MSEASRQVVHNAVNDLMMGDVSLRADPGVLPTHVMTLAHDLLRRVQGCAADCCTLADLMTACYQLGMSRALASVAAGLEGQR